MSSSVKVLKNKLKSEPFVIGRIRPYEFDSGIKDPAIFAEKKPFDAHNPSIEISSEGGDNEPGTRGSRAYTDVLELRACFNLNTSPKYVREFGERLWGIIERYVIEENQGKYWFSCMRPTLYERDGELVCSLDIQAKFMEN